MNRTYIVKYNGKIIDEFDVDSFDEQDALGSAASEVIIKLKVEVVENEI